MELSREELRIKAGDHGEAARFALDLLERIGAQMGAERFGRIEAAYVNTSFSGAPSHLDFLDFVVNAGGRVAVPTFANVGGWDRRNPYLRAGPEGKQAEHNTKHLMNRHREIGVNLIMTCAPYQLPGSPKFGAQIVCSESNAVSYFNSVIGARTAKYGDYADLAAALVGRVPMCGLHLAKNRSATRVLCVDGLPDDLATDDLAFQLIGHVMGRKAGADIPALTGLPRTARAENLRSVCASGASAGGVALFHAVGLTPEAPSLEAATNGKDCPKDRIGIQDLSRARQELTQFHDGPVDAVALGTPHASLYEVEQAARLLEGRKVADGVGFFIQMNRFVHGVAAERGLAGILEDAGATLVTDTCLYWRPGTRGLYGNVMTNSGKFSYYAPGELDVKCRIASLRECVESAARGRVWTDARLALA